MVSSELTFIGYCLYSYLLYYNKKPQEGHLDQLSWCYRVLLSVLFVVPLSDL